MKVLAIFGIAMLAFSTQSEARDNSQRGSLCLVNSSSYVVYRGEENFPAAMRDLNEFFSTTKAHGEIATPSQDKFADATTEFIQIEADVIRCANNDQPNAGISSIGGCDYVGCTGSVPHEFHSLPSGSSVSMTSCGGGVRTSGTFQKQANGTWKMTSYSTEQVTHCDPMG